MTLSWLGARQCVPHMGILATFRRDFVRATFACVMAAACMVAPQMALATCSAPADLVRFRAPLPILQQAITVEEVTIRIAALGSSSTAGTGASSGKMCYPARLEAELNKRQGEQRSFSVTNLGVGGELATDMLARLDSEVLALRPHLVIWQTGVNDAIRGVSIDDFRMTLIQGIAAIRATGADVVLMGMQYYPKSQRVALYRDYLNTMRDVAAETNTPILNRYGIMKHFIDTARYSVRELLASDEFHQNDFSYGCVSNLLADAIEDRLAAPAMRRADVPGDASGQMSLRAQSLRMSAAR